MAKRVSFILTIIISIISSCAWVDRHSKLKLKYNPRNTLLIINDLNYCIKAVKINGSISLLYESFPLCKGSFRIFSDLNSYLKPIVFYRMSLVLNPFMSK